MQKLSQKIIQDVNGRISLVKVGPGLEESEKDSSSNISLDQEGYDIGSIVHKYTFDF